MPPSPISHEKLETVARLCGGLALLVLVALFINSVPGGRFLSAAVVCSGGTTCTTSSSHLSLTFAGTGLVNNGDGSVSAAGGQTFTLTWPTPTGGAQDSANINCWGTGSTCYTPSQTFPGTIPRFSASFSDGTYSYFVGSYGTDSVTKLLRWLPGSSCFGDATTCGNVYQSIPGIYPVAPYTFTVGSEIFMAVANTLSGTGTGAVSYLYKWIPTQYAEGSQPVSTTPAFAGYTMVDRSLQLRFNNTVTKIGAYSSSVATITVKILKRNSAGNYDVAISQSCSHPGGGWYDCTLTTPFLVPAGTYYAGVYSAGNMGATSANVARAYLLGDTTGTGKIFTEDTNFTDVVRVVYQTALTTNGCFGDGVECANSGAVVLGENALQAFGNHYGSAFQPSFQSITVSGNTYLILSNYYVPSPDINSRVFTFKWMPAGTPSLTVNPKGCFGDGVSTCANSTLGSGYYQNVGVNWAHKITVYSTSDGSWYLIVPSFSTSQPIYVYKWMSSGTNCPTGGGWGDGATTCPVWSNSGQNTYQQILQQNAETVEVVPIGSDLYLLPGALASTITPIYKWISSGTNCPGSGASAGWGSDNSGSNVCVNSAGGGVFQNIGVDNTTGINSVGGWGNQSAPYGSGIWDGIMNGANTYIVESFSGFVYKWMPAGGLLGKGCFGNGTTCANTTSGANLFTTINSGGAFLWSWGISNLNLNGKPVLMTGNRVASPTAFGIVNPIPGDVSPGCTLYQKPASAGSFSSIATADSNATGVTVTPSENTDYKLECALTGGTVENTLISLHLSAVPSVTVTATDNAATEAAGDTGTFTITRSTVSAPSVPVITSFASNSSWTVPAGVTSVEVLVVGGGGGGGSRHGGGGGGGGVVSNVAYTTTPGAVMPITVGAGGQAGWYNGGVVNYGCTGAGGPGGNSIFGTITAKGGGGGKTYDPCTYVAGGSGGGGGGQGSSQSGGTATAGQGNVGGIGDPNYPGGGGGGGAGAVGGNYYDDFLGSNGGNGGNGVANSITGSSVIYGGGGGGGADSGAVGGTGGTGGGGHGGGNGGNTNQTAGTNGLGGGGGGTRSIASTEAGSVGGSGIVIVKYTPGGSTSVTTYLTSTTTNSWTVPADWNSANNSVEVIGGGGAGGNGVSTSEGSGGGGGAYSKSTNIALTPGASVSYSIGSAGFQVGGPCCIAQQGGDSWFNATSFAACTLNTACASAKGGGAGSNATGGIGGTTAGVGVVKYSGGSAVNKSGNNGSGGGGAGGRNGNGNPSTVQNGGAGDAGLGGAGGVSANPANPGSSGTEYDSTHGSGGGGSAPVGVITGVGGNGGNYGAGGGGGGSSSGQGGKGMSGLIVITYTPAVNQYPPLDVSYTMSGVATNGTDYQTISSSIHFADGEISKTITVTPTQDIIYEGPETVVLTIGAGASYAVGSPSSATVTITDDETASSIPSGAGSGGSFISCSGTASATCNMGIVPIPVHKGKDVTVSWYLTGIVTGEHGHTGDTCTVSRTPGDSTFPISSNSASWINNNLGTISTVSQGTTFKLICVSEDGTITRYVTRTVQILPTYEEI
jgi:hypothetical protein